MDRYVFAFEYKGHDCYIQFIIYIGSNLPDKNLQICFLLFRYYCNGSDTVPNPGHTICPIGNYCPEGSYKPIPCAYGTIAPSTGNRNQSDCEPCKPGNYCTPSSSEKGTLIPLKS